MALDAHGRLAIATIVFYVPLVFLATYAMIKMGVRYGLGWIYLWILVQVRIAASIVEIVEQTEKSPTTTIITVAAILPSVGLSPLLIAFISYAKAIYNQIFPHHKLSGIMFFQLDLVVGAGMAVLVVGGVKAVATDLSDEKTGATLRKVGAIILVVVFVLLANTVLFFRTLYPRLDNHGRQILNAMTFAGPLLAIRLLYSVLGAFAPPTLVGQPPVHSSLSKFNSVTGSWAPLLFMALLEEFLYICIFCGLARMIARSPATLEGERYEQVPLSSKGPSGKKDMGSVQTYVV